LSIEMSQSLNPAWYGVITRRRSRRRFDGTPLTAASVEGLEQASTGFRPFPDARVVFIKHAPAELFTGLAGSYGAVRGAPAAGVFVAAEGGEVSAGYAGEGFILEATRLGLGTCWIAGTFDKKRASTMVELAGGERVVSVTPVGTPIGEPDTAEKVMRRFVSADRRKELGEIAPSARIEDWPAWALIAVEAARLAPSGANRQPWRFRMHDGALIVSGIEAAYWTAKLDYGIAMLHAELGALHAGVTGRWERLPGPDVARFVPGTGSV
jgi:nitroreductase